MKHKHKTRTENLKELAKKLNEENEALREELKKKQNANNSPTTPRRQWSTHGTR